MKLTTTMHPRYRAISFAFAIGFIFISIGAVYAQSSPTLFQSPWRGFDTGIFGNGFGPASFAVGDLDGDGDADILVGDSFFGSTGVSVLMNNGDRTYARPVYYSLSQGQTVGEVALSDFDLDGDLDAIATIPGDYNLLLKIKVWRNNGNGSLSAPIDFATEQGPGGIVIGDFTGDGKPDVITANFRASSISLLQHNGLTGASAGFLAPVSLSTGEPPENIAAADLNGDGKLDIVVGGQLTSGTGASLSVMMNNGTGGFDAGVGYDPAPGATFGSTVVALTDLDNDGDFDLIGSGSYTVGSGGNSAVTIRLNNGSGTFGAAQIIPYSSYVPKPKELSTGDVNGDGFADIIAAVPSGRANEGFVSITSNGSGGFNTPIYYEASQQTFDVAVFDVDLDGDRDVVTLANSSAAITVHENPGNGMFQRLPRYNVASLSDAVENADIDNDGDIDIVVNGEVNVASNNAIVKILKNNGDGTFAPALDYSPPRNFADMKLRDINGDGFVDLIFAPDGNFPSYHIGTALNLGNGTFAPTVVKQLFTCGDGTIDAADLDGDGDRDIVLTEEEGCSGGAAVRIFILRNDGNQTFFQMPNLNPPGLPHGLALADVTGDGKADIITAVSGSMEVFPGNGNLTFGTPILSTSEPYKFTTGDFNHDGKLDLGMIMQQGSFGTDIIATALGNGNGTFQAIRTQTGSSVLENLRISDDLEAGDVNGDGTLDIVTFNYASNDVSIFLGNTDGSLRPHQRYGIGNTPQYGTLADFDGDGRLDVAAAIGLPPSGLENAIVILRNTAQIMRKSPADFDGDGKTDVSVFRPSDRVWYLLRSSAGFTAAQFGLSSDKIVPADYDGDGKTDIAVFRNGAWYVLRSTQGFTSVQFGLAGDVPVASDYDGDGKADIAVYRPSNNNFYLLYSSDNSFHSRQWGTGGDLPVMGDYDGDGKTDFCIFRPSTGTFYILQSSNGSVRGQQFGQSGDKPIAADFDGDGKTEIAVYRPSTGGWYYLQSTDNSFHGLAWGTNGDIPVAGDYDGDGKYDVAIFRPLTGTFYILQSLNTSVRAEQFGLNGDIPVPSAYVP